MYVSLSRMQGPRFLSAAMMMISSWRRSLERRRKCRFDKLGSDRRWKRFWAERMLSSKEVSASSRVCGALLNSKSLGMCNFLLKGMSSLGSLSAK